MTNILGLKITHDAAVAGISNGKLVFCVEIEKLNNNPRYTKLIDIESIGEICKKFNFTPDVVAVDGWKHCLASSPAGEMHVASYHEFDTNDMVLMDGKKFENTLIGPYVSYPHIAGHIIGTYMTSPFAERGESAYIITWDGGQNPRVHHFDPRNASHEPAYKDSLFELYGVIYGIMGYYYGPYKKPEVWDVEVTAEKKLFGGYDVPGKLMSYIGAGTPNSSLINAMFGIYHRISNPANFPRERDPLDYNQDGIMEHAFMREVKVLVDAMYTSLSDADVLRCIHEWLEIMLVDNAIAIIPKGANLCFSGGSALNIKWNSALRNTGHFAAVYVPPFPNDSGSAIGVACCAAMQIDNLTKLDWSVYCGMPIIKEDPEALLTQHPNWTAREMILLDLAKFLADNPSTPVVFLNGRAEVGPRALGNRSILCGATITDNKEMLNKMKKREPFRPVAPICLEEFAPTFFDPGTPDPYMLFDHFIRPDMVTMIPAVLHIDGTARLQTINREQNWHVYMLLLEYYRLTGVPCLCNTSANLNGSGFFPDVESAMRWPNGNHVWCDGILYSRNK
jgi:carbamoyltransferase